MLKVYAVNVSGIDVSDENILKKMSGKRLEKVNRIKPLGSKKQSIGAELVLNRALSGEGVKTPVEWETDDNGKLFIPGSDIRVNLSHSGDYAVCAVCGSEVGIDIECVKEANPALAKRFFTREEYEYVKNAGDSNDAFFELWVKKESFIKAVGKGLAIPLSSFSALGDTVEYDEKIYRFKKYSVKDKSYKLYVCFAV